MDATGLAAVVLAGGESRRLGRDKAMIELDGRTLLARAVELAGRLAPKVCVSGRDISPILPGIPWFADATARIGPMGGIMTALSRLGRPILVLSCDLPFMTEQALRRLADARISRKPDTVMTVYRHPDTGYIESLTAIYEPEALPYLEAAASGGLYKLSLAIPAEARLHVPVPEDASRIFFNVNRPEDLARLRECETAS